LRLRLRVGRTAVQRRVRFRDVLPAADRDPRCRPHRTAPHRTGPHRTCVALLVGRSASLAAHCVVLERCSPLICTRFAHASAGDDGGDKNLSLVALTLFSIWEAHLPPPPMLSSVSSGAARYAPRSIDRSPRLLPRCLHVLLVPESRVAKARPFGMHSDPYTCSLSPANAYE
jgi:hypothetical protein